MQKHQTEQERCVELRGVRQRLTPPSQYQNVGFSVKRNEMMDVDKTWYRTFERCMSLLTLEMCGDRAW